MAFIIIAVISIIITWLLDLFFKPKWVKYVLGILFFIITVYFIYVAKNNKGNGLEDLGYFAIALLTFTAMLSSVLTGVILDIKNRRK